jgi:hypothetical protein
LVPLFPSSKPSKFSIITIICKPHFGSYHNNLSIETQNLTIVSLRTFDNRHSNTTHYVISPITNQYIFQTFPSATTKPVSLNKKQNLTCETIKERKIENYYSYEWLMVSSSKKWSSQP